MILRSAFSAFLLASTAAAVCTKLEDCPQFEHLKTSECQTWHHFLVRGSTSPKPGHVIETVGKICNTLNTAEKPNACGYEDVEYWAMNGGDRWCRSAHEGAINGHAQMKNYTERCPDSHLILVGFSQGGSVALDILGGGGGELWGCEQEYNPPMNRSTAPGNKVAAALAFGATRRSPNQTYTHGGGEAYRGAKARSDEQLAGLQPFADDNILREYCQPRDPICAPLSENTDMSFHLSYFEKWGDETAEWVVGLARKAEGTSDQTSGASDMLKKTISHPIANVFILLIVLFGLYFLIRKFASWKTSSARLSAYAPVNTNESV